MSQLTRLPVTGLLVSIVLLLLLLLLPPLRAALGSQPSTTAPSQAELDAADTEPTDWLTYNKGYLGYRYAPSSDIDTANTAQVRVLCTANLSAQVRFESDLIEYDGVLYATAGMTTYAVDAGTCAPLWSYTYPVQGRNSGTAVTNRGVAIAAGRLFRGTGNGHLIALDLVTGALLWDQQATNFSIGEFISGAPVAWKGLVFVGKAGGERGIQGAVMAFSQTDGSPVWTFNTVPNPGDTGSSTWPDAFSIQHGGGATWSTFALDEARDLLLIPVGNPGPDNNHAVRAGADLFTASMVAVNARTGALSWWHQLVRGDARDWDTTVVAAIPGGGGPDLAAVAGKNGVLHVVDRSDGKLRYTVPLVVNYLNTTAPLQNGTTERICPIQAVEWNGPSYSPLTGMLYLAATDRCTLAMQGPKPVFQPDQFYTGWLNGASGTKDPISDAFSLLSAIDARTGALMWRTQLPAVTVGGLVATAGGVLITGGIDGQVVFLDAATGAILNTLAIGQPIGGGIISYTVNGAQRIAVAAGMTSPDYETTGTATIAVLGLPAP